MCCDEHWVLYATDELLNTKKKLNKQMIRCYKDDQEKSDLA